MLKFILIFVFSLSIFLSANADNQTIWITPSETDYSRLSTGLAGSNISIINENEIKNSSNLTLPEIVSKYSGVQLRNLYSNVNSTQTTLDLRGFGESAKNNSLILLNGRKLNDIDMSGVNLSIVPKESIKRIELIRGGSASTIYGDGAIGGAINIVTKNVSDTENILKIGSRSHDTYSSDILVPIKIDDNSGILVSASISNSDTYRQRSDFESENFLIRYNLKNENYDFYIDVNNNAYEQLLPGARFTPNLNGSTPTDTVSCNLLSDSRTAFQKGAWYLLPGQCLTRDPDYAKFDIIEVSAGVNIKLNSVTDINLNAANRDKEQKAFVAGGASTLGNSTTSDVFNHYDMETDYLSLRSDHKTFIGNSFTILSTGIDVQNTDYSKKSSQNPLLSFGGFVYASQESRAMYSQNSVNLDDGNSILSFGARLENAKYKVYEFFDNSISKFAFSNARDSYQTKMSNHAINIGIEHILDNQNRIYAKYAEAFRTPDLDSRNSTCVSSYNYPCSDPAFFLKDQTSDEIEVGVRHNQNGLNLNASIFEMNTLNEIRYLPEKNNTNLDPIKRKGFNLDFNYDYLSNVNIFGSFSYIDAHFTSGSLTRGAFEGTYAANSQTAINKMDNSRNLEDGTYNIAGLKVPLVSEYIYNLGLSYKISQETTFKIDASFVDEMFVSNDQENIEPTIPSYYLFDLFLTTENKKNKWSFGIDNIFNTSYYNFAVASSSHTDSSYGRQNMYPMERRSIFLDYSYKF